VGEGDGKTDGRGAGREKSDGRGEGEKIIVKIK